LGRVEESSIGSVCGLSYVGVRGNFYCKEVVEASGG
jgi:hypothetical protein